MTDVGTGDKAPPKNDGWPKRLLRSPCTWAVATALVRLIVLGTIPWTAHQLAIGVQTATKPPPQRPIEFLQTRALVAPLTEDEREYDEIGRNLAAGRGFVLDSKWLITTPGQPVAYAGFTYPVFVGAVYWIFGPGRELPVFLIQIVLAAMGAWWTVMAAAQVRGHVAGLIAGMFYTFHPTLIWSSVAMMSESICVPLVALLMYVLITPGQRDSQRILALAVLLAVLCLARSTFAYFVWIVAGLLVFEVRKRPNWRTRLSPALAFLAAFVVLVSPWTIRNYIHWKRVIPLSTKTGVSAWMHNHPGLKVELGPGVESGRQPVDVFDPSIQNLPDEPARNAKLMQMFLEFVRDHPAKFAGLVFMRFLMALLPVTVVSKTLAATVAAWYAKGVVLVALVVSVYQGHRQLFREIAPWLLFVAYWTLMQSLAGAGLRYRLPADPAWACIFGVLCSAIFADFRRWWQLRLRPFHA